MDFPAPLRPTSATICPERSSRSRSKTPAPLRNCRVTPCDGEGRIGHGRSPPASTRNAASIAEPRSGSSPSAHSSSAAFSAPIVAAAAMRASRCDTPRDRNAPAIASVVAPLFRASSSAQRRRPRHDAQAIAHLVPGRGGHRSPRLSHPRDRCGQRRQLHRLTADRIRDERVIRVIDEHRILRCEMPEEGHLGHPGAAGDRRRGRRVIASLVEQLERSTEERSPGPGELVHT